MKRKDMIPGTIYGNGTSSRLLLQIYSNQKGERVKFRVVKGYGSRGGVKDCPLTNFQYFYAKKIEAAGKLLPFSADASAPPPPKIRAPRKRKRVTVRRGLKSRDRNRVLSRKRHVERLRKIIRRETGYLQARTPADRREYLARRRQEMAIEHSNASRPNRKPQDTRQGRGSTRPPRKAAFRARRPAAANQALGGVSVTECEPAADGDAGAFGFD